MAGKYINTIEDENTGRPVNGATVLVYQDGATVSGDSVTSGTLATIYSDDGITTINQSTSPLTTIADGKFEFYTDLTRVVIAVLFNGVGIAVWNDVDVYDGTGSGDLTAIGARVDAHDTLFGTSALATDLGTFTGTIISDNASVKTALQELETDLTYGGVASGDPNTDRLVFWDDSAGQIDWNTDIQLDGSGNVAIGGSAFYGDLTLTGANTRNLVLNLNTANTSDYCAISFNGSTADLTASAPSAEIRFVRSGSAARGTIEFYTRNSVSATNKHLSIDDNGLATFSGLASFGVGANVTPAAIPATNAVGYLGSPQISDQDDYTLVMSDAGKHYYHVSATPHTLTIPANASVAFPIGTVIAIVNENGAGDITLAITSDTLRWTDQTGSRTIAANGTATLIKVTSTVWRLTGDGIT